MPKELIYTQNYNVCNIEAKLGTKGLKVIEAEILYKKASLLMGQKLGLINQILEPDERIPIGIVNAETYKTLKEVVYKFPESVSAINAQIRLSMLCSPDMTGNRDGTSERVIKVLKQIQNNYPNAQQSIYAGYLERKFMVELAELDYFKNRRKIMLYINELAAYEGVIKRYNRMTKSDIGDVYINRISLPAYYYTLVRGYCEYACDPKKAKTYVDKLETGTPNEELFKDAKCKLDKGCQCKSAYTGEAL